MFILALGEEFRQQKQQKTNYLICILLFILNSHENIDRLSHSGILLFTRIIIFANLSKIIKDL